MGNKFEKIIFIFCFYMLTFTFYLFAEDSLRIAIVIDDLGYSKNEIEILSELDIPLTVAIFPRYKYSKFLAESAVKNGMEVIIHMPMESVKKLNPGPGGIYIYMKDKEIIDVLDKNIKSVPYAIGINNHMGSAVTQDMRCMNVIMKELKNRGMLFIDSVVTGNICSLKISEKLNITSFKRDVFLDNIDDVDYIKKQFWQLIKIAKKYKKAIGIGHINKVNTIDVLKIMSKIARDEGVDFCYVSEMI